MLQRARDSLTRSPVQPEESIALRVAVGGAVMAGVAAVVAQDIVSNIVAVTVLVLTPAGMVLSWYRRHSRNIAIKFLLAGGAILALGNFLRSLSGALSVEEARAPLATIFLWVQMLHSFDLPRRRDLHFSLATSITLIALGGSLSIDSWFSLFFVPWGIFCLVALQLSYSSEVREVRGVVVSPKHSKLKIGVRGLAAALVVVLFSGGLAFAFTPRSQGSRFTSIPFRIPNFLPVPSGAGVLNPGLPNQSGPGDEPVDPVGGAYFGFGNFVDLRARGRLSETLVMRVRASRPAFWRGMVFDKYEGSSWTDTTPEMRERSGPPVFVRREPGRVETFDLVQTFFVTAEQPNIIFAAYNPVEVWFPTAQIQISDHLGLRSPTLLTPDTVYSVISHVPIYERTELERVVFSSGPSERPGFVKIGDRDFPERFVERYTQLPATLPQRVRDLAKEIAGDEPTILGKAEAIERWLAENTEYLIDIPPQPRGSDAVDHFLFEEKRGYCEQIASSMTVMLRSLGIPTRFATGYAPGRRNVLSGFFEVRQSDAHSWVEVYFPELGWVEFDPTHEVPEAQAASESVPGLKWIRTAAGAIERAIPDAVGQTVGNAVRAVLTSAASSGRRIAVVLLALAVAAAAAGFLRPRIRRELAKRRLRRLSRAGPGMALASAFDILEKAGKDAGMPRRASSTPREYAAAIGRRVPEVRADAETVVSSLEEHVYGGHEPSAEDAERASEAAGRASDALVSQVRPPG